MGTDTYYWRKLSKNMMNCEQVKIKLNDDFVAGKLNYRKRSEMYLHIQTCPVCKKEFDYFTRIASDISALDEPNRNIPVFRPIPAAPQKPVKTTQKVPEKPRQVKKYPAGFKAFAEKRKEYLLKSIRANYKKYREYLRVGLRYCSLAAIILAAFLLLVYGYNSMNIGDKLANMRSSIVSMLKPAKTKDPAKNNISISVQKDKVTGNIKTSGIEKNKAQPDKAKAVSSAKSASRASQRIGRVYIKKNNIIKNIKPVDEDYLDIVPDDMKQFYGEAGYLGKNRHVMTIKEGF
jgi:hypothetical protein